MPTWLWKYIILHIEFPVTFHSNIIVMAQPSLRLPLFAVFYRSQI